METLKNKTQFDQYIQYKALGFKFIGQSLPDSFVEAADNERGESSPLKNVCAKLHVDLSNKIDETVAILDIPKRKFIELALIEAIRKAEKIMDDVDIKEYLRDGESDDGESK